jgi:glutathione S-transferase
VAESRAKGGEFAMNEQKKSIELFYWPGIPGRGEPVRLALEDAGAAYVDVARDRENGMLEMLRLLEGEGTGVLPFAPPFVRVDGVIVSQTANILAFLAPRLGLVPNSPALRAEASQIQLTLADFTDEIHDTHHPIAGSLYYEDQKGPARRRGRNFVKERMPKFLGWLEKILARNRKSGGQWLVGRERTYVDLTAFYVVDGLRYAFPNAMAKLEPELPLLIALRNRVAERPRIARYLRSKRREPFNQMGVFRHYPELDLQRPRARR